MVARRLHHERMAKRIAAKELTHENWAEEEEPEEMGTFRQASSDQLVTRHIKKARRRGAVADTSSPSVFKGFTSFSGFGVNKDSTSQPSFSFLSKNSTETPTKPSFDFSSVPSTNTNPTTKPIINSSENKTTTQLFKFTQETTVPKTVDSSKTNGVVPTKAATDPSGKGGSKIFLAHLKALNEGVLLWVKQHLDKNPHVNLSPVFDDYKKHFEELSRKYPAASGGETDSDVGGASSNIKKDEASEKENKPLVSQEASTECTPSKNLVSSGPTTAEKSPETNKLFSFGYSSTTKPEKTTDSDTKSTFTFGGFGGSNKSSESSIFGGSDKNRGFTFGGLSSSQPSSSPSTGFTFTKSSSGATGNNEDCAETNEPSDEPPKYEVSEVKEEDALYEKKCKLFYLKDGGYVEKGVGTLFLKPAGEKTQLVIRALTNLGNILLNIILNASIPAVRAGKNGVIFACVPNPPLDGKSTSSEPVKMLIRVKTAEDADDLLEKMNELKK
ncbi:nuclear pore complex protein Nup50 isoform X2 [Procambarus clarkii]|uniref:nuclear pore complex protein Nup50 isoform X1 n=2 Tax=Procambarus clarkii TaxID=6728 RepID=UPI003743D6CE